jgi:hypothetical protein
LQMVPGKARILSHNELAKIGNVTSARQS